MYTLNMKKKLKSRKWSWVRIPANSEVASLLEQTDRIPHWKILDELVKQIPKSREDRAVMVFERFVEEMSELYPNKEKSFKSLTPLIIKQIVKKNKTLDGEIETLSDSYYEDLKKL